MKNLVPSNLVHLPTSNKCLSRDIPRNTDPKNLPPKSFFRFNQLSIDHK